MSTLMDQARTRVPRFADAAVERARLTVVPRRTSKAPKVPFVSLVSLLLVGGVVGLLLFNTSMQQASFTATSLQERATVLDAKEQSLQMELDTLRDPQRVAARAKRLGMVPASSPAFIRLSDGKVLGNPVVAEPTDGMRISPLPTRKPKYLSPDPVIVKIKKQKPVVASANARDTNRASANRPEQAGRKSKEKRDKQQGGNR
jgi:hypothetical protein